MASQAASASNSKQDVPKKQVDVEENEKITSAECMIIDAPALPKELDKEVASTFGNPATSFNGKEVKLGTPHKAVIYMYSDSKEDYGDDDCNTMAEKRPNAQPEDLTGHAELTQISDEGKVHTPDVLWGYLATIVEAADPSQKEIDWDFEEVVVILSMARDTFMKGDPLVECPAPTGDGKVAVFGDLHGQLPDLIRHLRNLNLDMNALQLTINTMRLVFLGDYVDRGTQQVEVALFVLILKILFPLDMFPLRGNHETSEVNKMTGWANFQSECKRRFGMKGKRMWSTFNEVFSYMPLACVIGKKILCLHGGISPEWKKLEDVYDRDKIMKPLRDYRKSRLGTDLLWADPSIGMKGFMPNARGVSVEHGLDVLDKFLSDNGLLTMVRGHQVMNNGVQFLGKNRKLICVFSASNTNKGNFSGVLTFDKDLVAKPILSYVRANATEAQCKADYDRNNQITDTFKIYKDCSKRPAVRAKQSKGKK